MKRTVKQWCLREGYDWYGPGVHGECRYDYKIVFGKGLAAFFKTAHGPSTAIRRYRTRNASFPVFPVLSQIVGKKEMTRARFLEACEWVRSSLARERAREEEAARGGPRESTDPA